MAHAPLPPGLSPVTAGRWGLWLLSRRSYRAARKRTAFPARRKWGHNGHWGHRLIHRWCELIVPWTVHEYPGEDRMLAAICGIAISSAHAYLKPSRHLPRRHAARLSDYLMAHAAECEALARELRAYAQDLNPLAKNR